LENWAALEADRREALHSFMPADATDPCAA
jgi:hypothetical protein